METPKKNIAKRILLIFILIVLFAIALLFDSNMLIDTAEYEIVSDDIPEAFDGYRIAVLSDLHENELGAGNAKLIAEVIKAEPDIIAVTGDLIDEPGHDAYVRNLMTQLLEIAPVYYVTGNHEWASGVINELFAILDETGVNVLRNEYVELERGGETIVLAGIDDPNGPYDMKTPQELMDEIRAAEGEDKYITLLAHRNDKVDLYDEIEAPLVLCGHGHGGIIRLPFTDGLISTSREWFPSYTSGVYEEDDTTLLVSRGLGNNTGIPRVFNKQHLPIAVLRCEALLES